MVIVCFYCPQFVPKRSFRILNLAQAHSTIVWTWGGWRWGGGRTLPRVVWGNVLVAVKCLWEQKEGWKCDWLVSELKRVICDFGAVICRSFSMATVPQPQLWLWERLLLFVASRATLLHARRPCSRFRVGRCWGRWKRTDWRATGLWLSLAGRRAGSHCVADRRTKAHIRKKRTKFNIFVKTRQNLTKNHTMLLYMLTHHILKFQQFWKNN